jgi:hypothetical protein
MIQANVVAPARATKKDLVEKTLSESYPLRGKAKDDGKVMTFEDLQEAFCPNDHVASHLFQSIVSFAVGIYLNPEVMELVKEKGLLPPTMK